MCSVQPLTDLSRIINYYSLNISLHSRPFLLCTFMQQIHKVREFTGFFNADMSAHAAPGEFAPNHVFLLNLYAVALPLKFALCSNTVCLGLVDIDL